MQIEINKKKYELKFGFAFIRQINRLMGLELDIDGQLINTQTAGMEFLEASFTSLDPVGLVNAIEAGTVTLSPRPTRLEIENYVAELLEKDVDGYIALFGELEKTIKEDTMLAGLAKVAERLKKAKE